MEVLKEDYDDVDAGPRTIRGRRVKFLKPIIGKTPVVLSKETGIPGQPKILIKRNHLGFFKKIGRGLKKAGKKLGKVGRAVVTGGASVIVENRKKIGKGIAKAAKGVAKVVKKVTVNSILLPVIPFVPAMRKALKKKGLTPPKDLGDLVRMFHKVIIQKKSNLASDSIAPIVALIPPIIGFFKTLLSRKKSGAPLTPDEKELADDGEKVLNDVVKTVSKTPAGAMTVTNPELAEEVIKADETTKETAAKDLGLKNEDGTINFKNPWIIGGLAAALFIIILLVIKRK